MNKRELMGHCFCSSRFRQLLKMIETDSLEQVLEIQQLHKSMPKNFKYQELEEAINKRLS